MTLALLSLLLTFFPPGLLSPAPLLDTFHEDVLLAYSSYCEAGFIAHWACYWCNLPRSPKLSDVFCTGDTPKKNQGYIGLRQSKFNVSSFDVVVSFRGSQDPMDEGIPAILNWIFDADFFFSKWKYIPPSSGGVAVDVEKESQGGGNSDVPEVHNGFLKCVDDVYPLVTPQLEALVKQHEFEISSLTFASHSLGAAISGLYGLRLYAQTTSPRILELFETKKVYFNLFGSPRFGNDAFFELFHKFIPKENYFRVVNQKDMVTGIPPQFVGYRHLATEYWFQNDTTHFKKCDGTGEDPDCADSVLRDSAADHSAYLGILLDAGHSHGCN